MQLTSPNRLVMVLILVALAMFGFGFAMVPLYSVLCKTLGLNGKTENVVAVQSNVIDQKRTVTIEFIANTNAALPWDFYPETKKITLHPGENKLVKFYARNNSAQTMTVQAIPSVSPGPLAKYLKKTECFCFTQQTFKANEARDMPVLFHLDTDFPKDVNTLTLAYTMFDVAQLSHASSKTVGRIQ